jgi:hypothetical protein
MAQLSDSELVSFAKGDINKFSAYLVSGTVHGKPGLPVAELARVKKVLSKNLNEEELFQLGKKLAKRDEYSARSMAVSLINKGWPEHKEVPELLKGLSDDEDWIVRESAAGGLAYLLGYDFNYFSKLFLDWIKNESTNVKRAVALAVKYDSYSGEKSRWKTYFKMIDPLMKEEVEYIRKNLGPFAIGDGLMKHFDSDVLKACEKWMISKNENVRWNTAMIFTAAAARKHKKSAQKILKFLASDSYKPVVTAVKSAQRNLLKS